MEVSGPEKGTLGAINCGKTDPGGVVVQRGVVTREYSAELSCGAFS